MDVHRASESKWKKSYQLYSFFTKVKWNAVRKKMWIVKIVNAFSPYFLFGYNDSLSVWIYACWTSPITFFFVMLSSSSRSQKHKQIHGSTLTLFSYIFVILALRCCCFCYFWLLIRFVSSYLTHTRRHNEKRYINHD